MKTVLLHDWLTGFRGGERVLEAFCQIFPEAPIYTLFHHKNSTSETLESKRIEFSYLNSWPGISRHYRKFLPLFPHACKSLKLEACDLVLSSSHCVIKGAQIPGGAAHISYIHSPMRYLYDLYDDYFGAGSPAYQRLGMGLFRGYLTRWDQSSNQQVNSMIANSSFVQSRIRRYYGRDSDVIHPFVEMKDFSFPLNELNKGDHYLILSAFAPNKKIDLALRACRQKNVAVRVIGSGQQEQYLRSLAGPKTEFLGNLSRDQVISELQSARALIFPGIEDFGIVPLEALASGTPVIAYKVGGVLETLTPETAVFFEEQTEKSLLQALEDFEVRCFDREVLRNRAKMFSKEIFIARMKDYITEKTGHGFA